MGYKVNVGCGEAKMLGYVNVDIRPDATGAERIFDATKPWPFAPNSVEDVFSSHALEHMENYRGFFRHLWEAMEDGGHAMLVMPYGAHETALADPQHYRPWFPTSFGFLSPRSVEHSHNPEHNDWQWPFGIVVVQLKVNPRLQWLLWRPWRRWTAGILSHLWNGYTELGVTLMAIKSPQSFERWQKHVGDIHVVRIYPTHQFHITKKL